MIIALFVLSSNQVRRMVKNMGRRKSEDRNIKVVRILHHISQ